MSLDNEHLRDWWAQGDTPVHSDSRVTYLVDGRTAMLLMCQHFLRAHKYIYLANWGMTSSIELVRGADHRAGPDGSPAQERLINELRSVGLQQADIDFWRTHDLSLVAVLGYAVSKGVQVKVLLWDSITLPFISYYNPKAVSEQLSQVGVTCLLDDSARGILHHPVESLHQKISIVDGTHAFVGGVDPMIEHKGEFDRWDTQAHLYASPLRRTQEGVNSYPWHDAHSLIEGPAAGDVELNFRQRWNDVIQRHHKDSNLLVPVHPSAPPLKSNSLVQVARTIPEHTYAFTTVQGIAQLYSKALGNAQHFIYLENQYFWLHDFIGIDIPFLSGESPDMMLNIRKIGEALQRGTTMAIVLPDHPNLGRADTDAGLALIRQAAPEAVAQGRVQAFCLATSTHLEDTEEHYRPIYVHAKVAIIDDVWSTVGSGNLNNRGMRDDTEMNVATLDAQLALGLRLMLWSEHLGLLTDEEMLELTRYIGHQYQIPEENARGLQIWGYLHETIGNPLVGLRMMAERAQDNLRRFKAKQPLVGHLLPYLTAAEATQQGLNFHEEHGWVEEPSDR